MEERFLLKEVTILPIVGFDINLCPRIEEYTRRVCVIDKENQIAIDVKTKLQYDYLEKKSQLHFLSQLSSKIKDGADKRFAIYPEKIKSEDDYDLIEVSSIIKKLKNGEKFQDGNEVYNNEQYLEYLKQEKLQEGNKTKKIGKRKKDNKKKK